MNVKSVVLIFFFLSSFAGLYLIYDAYIATPGGGRLSLTGALTAEELQETQVEVESAIRAAKDSGEQITEVEVLLAHAKLLKAQGRQQEAYDKLVEAQSQLNDILGEEEEPLGMGSKAQLNLTLSLLLFSVSAATLLFYFSRTPEKKAGKKAVEVKESEKFARFTTSDDVVQKLMNEKK
ncbi:hypothetical protein KJ765_03405 [Candidatus Micrarchaeota archaeon]|nr:hypothetical protein [Candidatus Micrarchaeota archaeon]